MSSSSNPTSEQVIHFFKGRCVVCVNPATVTHEIEPRSRGNNPLRFENRVALCNECHEWVHNHGVDAESIALLKWLRQNRIDILYGANPPQL